MTRLERAVIDYAIALLAPGDLRALDMLVEVERLEGLPCWEAVCAARFHAVYMCADDPHLRLTCARVALYLRLLRRVDAWEASRDGWRYDQSWSEFRRTDPTHGPLYCFEPWDLPATPWRPLWLDAPAHDPQVTPKMRRRA